MASKRMPIWNARVASSIENADISPAASSTLSIVSDLTVRSIASKTRTKLTDTLMAMSPMKPKVTSLKPQGVSIGRLSGWEVVIRQLEKWDAFILAVGHEAGQGHVVMLTGAG